MPQLWEQTALYQKRPDLCRRNRQHILPIPLSLKGYQILIIKPDVFVSTREAFANIHPHHPEYSIKEAIKRPVNEWKEILINDFEDSVFPSIR